MTKPPYIFLVTFTLNSSEIDYSDFHGYIKQYENVRLCNSTYIIASNMTQMILMNALTLKCDPKDTVYIIPITEVGLGYGSGEIAQFLGRYLSSKQS